MLVAVLVQFTDVRRGYEIDDVVELDDHEAALRIEQGLVELVKPDEIEVETATVEAGDEQAVTPPRRRRGRPRKG